MRKMSSFSLSCRVPYCDSEGENLLRKKLTGKVAGWREKDASYDIVGTSGSNYIYPGFFSDGSINSTFFNIKPEIPNLRITDFFGWMGAVLCFVGCLAASLASTH